MFGRSGVEEVEVVGSGTFVVEVCGDVVDVVVDVLNVDDVAEEGVGEADDVGGSAVLERSEELAVGVDVGSGSAVLAVAEDSEATELELVSRLNNRSLMLLGVAAAW